MIRLCAVFVLLIFLVVMIPVGSAETAPSSWLKTSVPSLQLIHPLDPSGLPPYTYNSCLADTKFVTIPRDILKGQAEASSRFCAIQSSFGIQSVGSSLIQLNNSSVAGPVKDANGSSLTVLPVPNSSHLIYTQGAYDGAYLFLVKDFAANSKTVVNPNGSIYHQLKPGVVGSALKDQAGTPLAFFTNRFSDNGKWLVGEVPGRGLTRVNLETGQALTFGDVYNHWNGTRPQFVTSITGNGRYVLAADSRYSVLRLYDLATCASQTDPTKKAACQTRDMLSEMRGLLAGFQSVYHAQFSTDNSIRLYMRYVGPDGADRYGYYLLTAPGEKESSLDYLALGDSFASGEGIYVYKTGTDIEVPFNKCHLSLLSYPYLLAAPASLSRVESVACSGARLKDTYFSGGSAHYSQHDKQSSGKESVGFDTEIYSNFLVGYRPQIDFVEQNKPIRLTVSIGGNDIGFGKILLACIMPGTCFADHQDKANLMHTADSQLNALAMTYRQIKEKAGSGAFLYVLGYPSLADPKGSCALNVHLNRAEIEFSNQLISRLNGTIRQAAARAGATYIDVEQAFAGYRLCETDSHRAAVNGLGVGNDKTASIPLGPLDASLEIYLSSRESYHPNRVGHQLYAKAIAASTTNLATPSPTPVLSATEPSPANARIIFDERPAQSLLVKGKTAALNGRGFAAGSTIKARLDGLELGNVQTDSQGSLAAKISLQAGARVGPQFLRLNGKNPSGETVEIWQLVYVASSETDIDGDGVPNDQEKCLPVEESGVDSDKDGRDDACDAQISQPSATLKVSPGAPAAENDLDKIRTESASLASRNLEVSHGAPQNNRSVLSSGSARPAASRAGTPPASKKSDGRSGAPSFAALALLVIFLAWLRWRKRRQKGTIRLSL